MILIIFFVANVLFFSPSGLEFFSTGLMKKQFGTIILSGGVSERMGKPKAFLKIGNTTFLEKIISAYRQSGIENTIVILNNKISADKRISLIAAVNKNIEFISNAFPELGRFYSIQLGLQKLHEADYCFIQNIDNPFIDADLICRLKKHKNPFGFVQPVFERKGGHPVLISKRIMEAIKELKSFDFNLRDLLNSFDKKQINVNRRDVLVNINTEEDYENYIIEKKFTI